MATGGSRTLEVGASAKSNNLQIFDCTPSTNFTQYQMSLSTQSTRNPLKLPKTVIMEDGSLEVAKSLLLHIFWHPVAAD